MKRFVNRPKSSASRRSFVEKQSATGTATKVASLLFAVLVAVVFHTSPATAQSLLRTDRRHRSLSGR